MTRKEVIALAPNDAWAVVLTPSGESVFLLGDNIPMSQPMAFDDGCVETDAYYRIIALCKDGEWGWMKNKNSEAARIIENLGWKWDEKSEKWDEAKEAIFVTDGNGNEQQFLVPKDEA